MGIAVHKTEYQGASDPSWLGTAHGTDAAGSATLDVSKFTAATHFPLGFVRGGTPVAKITATGLYGPYTPADSTTGLGTLAGFVLWDVPVATGATREPFALYDHGKVVTARLPIAVDADGRADVATRIQFV
jgi:hypothetical protein